MAPMSLPHPKTPVDQLTISPHAVATFWSRSGVATALAAVDEMRRLYALAVWSGVQPEPRGRGFKHGRRLKAPMKPLTVNVWQTFEGRRHWVFYVRGRVLLTAHLHEVKPPTE